MQVTSLFNQVPVVQSQQVQVNEVQDDSTNRPVLNQQSTVKTPVQTLQAYHGIAFKGSEKTLNVGDKIKIGSGHADYPEWLKGQEPGHFFTGRIIGFIPRTLATVNPKFPDFKPKDTAVVELDSPMTFENVTGKYLLLSLRYMDSEWKNREIVQVTLATTVPEEENESEIMKDKKNFVWAESAALYEKIK